MTARGSSTPRQEIDGVLLLDKPEGMSSTSALGRAKFLLNAKKGGHTGTLDPFATGLLPLCFGEATKFARFMLDAEKSYRATLQLGSTSSTGDTEGVITPYPVQSGHGPSRTEIKETLIRFLGAQTQVPPMHSALKVGGVPLYKMARRGEEIEREPRAIVISSLDLVEWDPPNQRLVIDAVVSKGTYLRVLAADIGEALGCGAFLTALRRTGCGGFTIDQTSTFTSLEAMEMSARPAVLLPPEVLCRNLPAIRLSASSAAAFLHGQAVSAAGAEGQSHGVFSESGQFLGVGSVEPAPNRESKLLPTRLMQP